MLNMARRFLNLCNGLLNTFVLIVLVVLGCYAGFALWDNGQIYASVDNVQAELMRYKPAAQQENESESQLFELQAINEDVQAWLTLDNTKIDYPLMYNISNLYYLSRNVYQEFALAGSIFIDARCDPQLRNAYNLVHGHHMENRYMFGDLDLYKDRDFFFENRTGTLILPDRIYSLQTFACLLVSSFDDIVFEPDKWAEDIEQPLKYARSDVALHYDEEQIERLLQENEEARLGGKKPQIIVLATCSSESDDARTILLAEMIEVQPEEEKEEEI